jgi:hypothetical protein
MVFCPLASITILFVVAFENAADIADVVHLAGGNEVGVINRLNGHEQRPPLHDVMARERDEHGVFDIVIERIAVADAFKRESDKRRNQFRQTRVPRTVNWIARLRRTL